MPPTCPTTSSAISKRSRVLNCDQTFKYHCMRDKEDGIVEKCLEISWIEKGDCAVYDKDAQKIDSWKCIGRQGICPRKVYLSNQVMSYSACVPSPKQTNSSMEKETFETSNSPSDGSRLDNTHLPLILVAVTALIAAIIVVIIIYMYRRRRRPSQADPEEEMPLNEQTDSSGKHESTTEDTRYDSDPYYKTKTYEHIEKLLKDSAVSILIVGHPGSGKSVLVKMLNDKFRRKKVVEDGYHDSMYMKCLEDVETHKPDDNTRMIYIVEDCFEEWNQYPHLASQGIEKLIDLHKKIIDKGHCLLVTLSKWNYKYNLDSAGKAHLKQCKKLEVIDLSTKEFQLDITDKNGILEYHRKKTGSTAQRMDEKEVRKVTDPGFFQGYFSNVLELNLELEFPLSCRLFYSHDSFVAQKKDFFNDTKQKIWEFVRGLARGSSEEKNQYCTLIYAALCGGKIHSKNKTLFFLKDIANVAKIDLQYPQFDFECCLIIQGTDINSHEIVHEEITKLLFKEFGIAHIIFVINKCDTGILLKYVRTDDRVRTGYHIRNGLLILRNNIYKHLAKRLMNLDTEKRNHIIFKDRQFEIEFRTAWKVPQESETEL